MSQEYLGIFIRGLDVVREENDARQCQRSHVCGTVVGRSIVINIW